MKRWTSRDESGRYHLKRIHGYEPKKADLVQRVGAYEDSGFEPEEIKSLQAEWNANKMALDSCRELLDDIASKYGLYHDGMGDAILNLLQAQKEDRLVALPCKVGDTVYIPDYEKGAVQVRVQGISISVSGRTILRFGGYPVESAWGDGCGKDWFLTREEAEEALQSVTNRNGLERDGHE